MLFDSKLSVPGAWSVERKTYSTELQEVECWGVSHSLEYRSPSYIAHRQLETAHNLLLETGIDLNVPQSSSLTDTRKSVLRTSVLAVTYSSHFNKEKLFIMNDRETGQRKDFY